MAEPWDEGMLIFDRENWPHHRPWALFSFLVLAGSTGWYVMHGLRSGAGAWNWPSGASPPGFALGLAGGAIIGFEMLLWPRKYLWRGLRLGRTKYWMAAHLWLGFLCFPLLLLHGSFHFALSRSTLASVLMWLLLFVFLSGLLGAALQHILPRVMLVRIPAETIYGQISHVLSLYRREAEQLVLATCGPAGGQSAERAAELVGDEPKSFVVSESLRQVGQVQGKVVETRHAGGRVPDSEPLQVFFVRYIEPYLEAPSGQGLALGFPGRAVALFRDLKLRLPEESRPAADRLEELCDQRRQFDLQRRLHRWLHLWIAVHLVLSSALFLLMLIHGYLALKYA